MGLGICGFQPCFISSISHLTHRVDKKFYRPTSIQSFAIVVFERKQRFNENDAREVGKNLLDACRQVGIIVQDTNPSVFFANGQNGVIRVSTSPYPFPQLSAHYKIGTIGYRQSIRPDEETDSPPSGCRVTRRGIRHLYRRQTVSVALPSALHRDSTLPTASVTFA